MVASSKEWVCSWLVTKHTHALNGMVWLRGDSMSGFLIKRMSSPHFLSLRHSLLLCYMNNTKAFTRCRVFELLSLKIYEPSKFLFINQLGFVVFCYSNKVRLRHACNRIQLVICSKLSLPMRSSLTTLIHTVIPLFPFMPHPPPFPLRFLSIALHYLTVEWQYTLFGDLLTVYFWLVCHFHSSVT